MKMNEKKSACNILRFTSRTSTCNERVR